MPPETSELPDDPIARVAATAKRSGDASDAFTRQAIAKKAGRAGQEASAANVAEDRYARILASDVTIRWQELRRYLIAHVAGVALPLPAPRRPVR